MTWKRFLEALARGGWLTDVDIALNPKPSAANEIACRSVNGDVVIESRWAGIGRKFAGATINGLEAGSSELAAALK